MGITEDLKRNFNIGYTRGWMYSVADVNRGRKFSEEFLTKVNKVIAAAEEKGIHICSDDGTGEPEITEKRIWLNGDYSADQECEPFFFPATTNLHSDYCKTKAKPYDSVVHAILYLAKKYGYISLHYDDGEYAGDQSHELLLAAGE